MIFVLHLKQPALISLGSLRAVLIKIGYTTDCSKYIETYLRIVSHYMLLPNSHKFKSTTTLIFQLKHVDIKYY